MAERKIFNIDDTIQNQDWIKARSFDFASADKSTLEATFGLLGLTGKKRTDQLRKISEWPTMRNAPDWLKKEIDELPEKGPSGRNGR